MDRLGLDNYAGLYYKLSIFWMAGLGICLVFGIWLAVYKISAVCIPVIESISILSLLGCNNYNSKKSAKTNIPLKLNIVLLGVIFLANTGLSVWISVIFEKEAETIANLVILWLVSAGMMISYLCLGLPVGIVFWNLRSEDLAKAQAIGGVFVAPAPIPLSSGRDQYSLPTPK